MELNTLGRLRFGGIPTYKLIDGIIDKFEKLTLPLDIEAIERSDWHGEYMTLERYYGISSHKFLTKSNAAPEQLIAREAWRLPFLRRLFIEVLDNNLKVFVLRRPCGMHISEAYAVAAALRLHGDNKLLWAVHGANNKHGAVEVESNYFIRGFLDTTSGLGSSSMQAWLNICFNAYTAFRGGKDFLLAD